MEMNNPSSFDVPVVMIVFRRLDLVKKVFETVKTLKPSKLYIISDGPRNDLEKQQVSAVREYIENNIDWQCELHKNYADKNIGLRFRMPTGVDWVFETEDRAIFLEDDICADQSFFWFCKDMLDKYERENQVMMVSGMNVYPDDNSFNQSDIIFSRIPLTWGWATWKRAWEKFDVNIIAWSNPESKRKLKNILTGKAYRFFVNIYDDLQYQWINDAWDYQWELAMFLNDGIGIIPRKNMISNLGMNTEGAEHLGDSSEKEKLIADIPVASMPENVKLPDEIIINQEYDTRFQNAFYPATGLAKYLKLVYRAHLNRKAMDVIKKLETDDEYFNNSLEDRYKLSSEESKLYGNHRYKQISGKEMRESARKYKKQVR